MIKATFLLMVLFNLSALSCQEARRPFYMGFSPWPHDATQEAVDWTYRKLAAGGDIVSHHMEEGVPWQESLNGAEFPHAFAAEIQARLNRREGGKKILLSISPLNMNRDALALNRGTQISMPLSPLWNTQAFNSLKVKSAFLNYAKTMVDYFEPDYLIIGIEVNLLIQNNPDAWDSYVELHQHIYAELKALHPELPLGISVFSVPFFPEWSPESNLDAQIAGLKDIEPWADFISFSVHPFMSALLAEHFPEDYFQRLFSLTDKPVSVSESSYPAQTWQLPPNLEFNGTPRKQDDFLTQMLNEAAGNNALFVIWFSVRDFDALWNGPLNRDPAALIWRDTGLFDESGNPRKAWKSWMRWYQRKLEN